MYTKDGSRHKLTVLGEINFPYKVVSVINLHAIAVV